MKEVLEDLSWSHFLHSRKFYKISVIFLLDIIGLENFPLSYDV